jgi:hypothetical protein
MYILFSKYRLSLCKKCYHINDTIVCVNFYGLILNDKLQKDTLSWKT